MANCDGVPDHWEGIHKQKNHSGNFFDGCSKCLKLFNDPRILFAVISVS